MPSNTNRASKMFYTPVKFFTFVAVAGFELIKSTTAENFRHAEVARTPQEDKAILTLFYQDSYFTPKAVSDKTTFNFYKATLACYGKHSGEYKVNSTNPNHRWAHTPHRGSNPDNDHCHRIGNKKTLKCFVSNLARDGHTFPQGTKALLKEIDRVDKAPLHDNAQSFTARMYRAIFGDDDSKGKTIDL